MQDCDAIAA